MKTGRKPVHGHAGRLAKRPPEYVACDHMKRRCLNKQHPAYKDYGGRGIGICESWLLFENFLKDMGNKPSAKHTLDRINNDGDYEPGNVRWATRKEQARNQRNNRRITFGGECLTVTEWAERLNIDRLLIYRRLSWGWSEVDALTKPSRKSANPFIVQ